jgi:two-component system, oxyanion-binding sensor
MVARNDAARPDRVQAAWLYAQMVRWRQAPMSPELHEAALAVFRPDLYDEVLGPSPARPPTEPSDGVGAFAGPRFDPSDIAGHLAPWTLDRKPAR